MESQLVYIIRGLPAPFDQAVAAELIVFLENRRSIGSATSPLLLLNRLDSARDLMVPLPDYDITDFDSPAFLDDLDGLTAGEKQIWAQLLDALNDRHSREYALLKALSPFADKRLMFFEIPGNSAALKLDLEPDLAQAIMSRCEVHQFPGNSGMIVVSDEALDALEFVDCVDNIPATA